MLQNIQEKLFHRTFKNDYVLSSSFLSVLYMKLPCRHVLLINYLLCTFSFPGVFLNLVSIFEFLKKEKLLLEDLRSKGII